MENSIKLKAHWAYWLALAFLWCYGYQAALYDHAFSVPSRVVVSFLALGVFALWLGPLARQKTFEDSFTFSREDGFLFSVVAWGLFALSFGDLFYSLNGDQLYHAQQSQRHIMRALDALLPNPYLVHIEYRALLQGFGLLATFAAFAFAWLLHRRGLSLLWVGVIAFVLLRVSGISVNASYDPHAPLRLMPLWLSGTLLSHHAFAYKLPQFICWLAGLFALFQIAKPRLGQSVGLLFALTASTIPLLWHVALVVEHSIYTAVVWTTLLCHLAATQDFKVFPWVRWCGLICLASLIRYPAILALLPLGLYYLVYEKIWQPRTIVMACPVLLLALPIVIKAQLFGTPATYLGGSLLIPEGTGMFGRAWIALGQPEVQRALLGSHAMPWLVALACVFLPFRSKIFMLTAFAFFALSLVVFFSIQPGLWELPRYRAEHLTPFAIAGLFVLCQAAWSRPYTRGLVIACLLGLLITNLWQKATFFTPPAPLVAEIPHPFDKAFSVVKQEGLASNTLVAGVTYGVFNEVLHDYSVEEYLAAKALFEKHHAFNPMSINSDSKINLVLLDEEHQPNLGAELEAQGWWPWLTFRDEHRHQVLRSYHRH